MVNSLHGKWEFQQRLNAYSASILPDGRDLVRGEKKPGNPWIELLFELALSFSKKQSLQFSASAPKPI